MAEELQQLLDKIQKDGIEKADAEAAKRLAEAQARAEEIVASARHEAQALRQAAQADADAYAQRAKETLAQAARDTVKKVEHAIARKLEALLLKNVDAALGDPAVATPIAAEALAALCKDGACTIKAAPALVRALQSQLAGEAAHGITFVTDETAGTGFSVSTHDGRVEHAFTGRVVADALACRLRDDLAALLG